MTATEARKLADDNNKSSSNLDYQNMQQCIELAARGGHINVYVDKIISNAAKKLLEADGYKVLTGASPKNESYTEIRW